MLIDKSWLFCDDEDLAGSAGTAKIGDAFDSGVRADWGVGEPLWLVCLIGDEALAGGTSLTLQLVTADNEALTTNVTVVATSATVLTAAGTLGTTLWALQLPSTYYREWIGLRAVEAGTFSAGSVTAFLTQQPDQWRAYAEGNN